MGFHPMVCKLIQLEHGVKNQSGKVGENVARTNREGFKLCPFGTTKCVRPVRWSTVQQLNYNKKITIFSLRTKL